MARRSRGGRLAKQWSGATFDKVAMSTTQVGFIAFTATEGGEDETVLRVRGDILVVASPDAAADSAIFALGAIVVQVNAFSVGGLSLPGPVVDIGADWLWHTFVSLEVAGATSVAGDNIGIIHRVVVDSKAMRRVPDDSMIAFVGELTAVDFAAVEITGGLRVLSGR